MNGRMRAQTHTTRGDIHRHLVNCRGTPHDETEGTHTHTHTYTGETYTDNILSTAYCKGEKERKRHARTHTKLVLGF